MRRHYSQYGCLEIAVWGGIVLGRLELDLCRDVPGAFPESANRRVTHVIKIPRGV